MGMYCTLRRVPLEKLESYLKDSQLLENDFYSNELTEIPLLDIDKSWDGIIFLLKSESKSNTEYRPLEQVILGSAAIDDKQDLGYGPAKYLLPAEVKDLNNQIKNITVNELKNRFDASKMIAEGIYPDIWEEENNSFEYLEEYFVKLQSFYQHASWANEAVIIIID